MSFDDFYDAALASGMDFTPKEIEDADGNMIPNPEYGGDEAFATKKTFDKLSNYNSNSNTSLDPKNPTTLASEFSAIKGKETDSQDQAAPVVLKAFTVGLAKLQESYGSSLDIKVEGVDVDYNSTNEIVVTYKDPVTGNIVPHTFKYKEDNTKLQSEVDAKINEIIDAYNSSKASGKNKPVGSGVSPKVDAWGNVIK